MAASLLALIAVRPFRIITILVSSILVTGLIGCSHRRSSMRPVYRAPIGNSVITTPAVPGGIITNDPDGGEPVLTPVPSSSISDGVIRAGGSPPVPPEPESEPALNDGRAPAPTGSSKTEAPVGIELTRPSAYRNYGRKPSVKQLSPRVSLRDAISPHISDPSELFQPSRADRPWKYIVLHHSANSTGGLDQIDRDHRKVLGFEGCGYHFVIGNGTDSPDGQIEVASRWTNQKNGVHCRNGKNPEVNENGIGICLIGNFDQSQPTPNQVAAARALVAYLADRYRISSDRLGSHNDFADGPTACPGKNFPSEAIFGSKHLATR